MKTIEEKLQICKECKNRIEYHSGLTCSITSSRPEFDDECPNYDPDHKEIEKNIRRAEKEEANKTKVRGWLAFFLWVGIAGGMIFSIGKIILNNEFGTWLYSIICLAPMIIVAVMTIYAFYRRKDNAVALAYTYIGMMALNSVFAAILLIIGGDMYSDSEIFDSILDIFKSLVWAVTWGSFIKMSDRVKNVIPIEIRKWKAPEKVLLLVYILMLGGIFLFANSATGQMAMKSTASIDSMIEQLNAESMPNDLGDGVILKSVAKDNDMIAYSYVLTELEKREYDTESLDAYFLQSKYSVLSLLFYNPERDQFSVRALNENYKLLYSYEDKNGESLGDVLITPQDYKRVIGNNGYNIVEEDVLNTLLKVYNGMLPCEYLGDAQLESIDMNYQEKSLVYSVKLPEMTMDEMSAITQSYLSNYISENWNAIEDSMITLAKINRMDIVFSFKAHYSGKDYAEVRITPDQYLQ